MYFFKMARLFPCLLVLLCQLFQLGLAMEDSKNVHWYEMDMTGVKDNGKWKNITQWMGRQLCVGGRTKENPYTCEDFMKFALPLVKDAKALRYDCQCDKALNGALVCWLRQKSFSEQTIVTKRTDFEVQFWTDHPNMSHCRFATPTPVYED
uniref:Uncharacterized protein n=1 Tax=Cacopsylla melanoneura TaxID=428564 RepID=A0A8D8T2N8_9HEMI